MSEFSYKLGMFVKQSTGLGDVIAAMRAGQGAAMNSFGAAGATANTIAQAPANAIMPHIPDALQPTPPPAPEPTLIDKAKELGGQGLDKAKELGGQGLDLAKQHPYATAGIGAGALGAGALGYWLMNQNKKKKQHPMQGIQ